MRKVKNTESLAFVIFPLKAGQIAFGFLGIFEHQDGGFLNRPFEMMVTDFLVGVTSLA